MSRVTIERLAAGGDGVGRLPDGLTVFVPRTAPADQVDVDVVERRPRFARGLAGKVHEAGPDRATAPCPHYVADHCGGCQLQHLTLEAQLKAKRTIVGDALRRIGKRVVADPPIVPASDPWRYRSKITLAVKGERIGLHRFDRPADVFALDDCHITRVSLMALWALVRSHKDLLPAKLESVVLRESRGGERHVVLECPDAWDAAPLATAVGDAAVSYWWKPLTGAARVVHGPATGFPALAFEQSNPALAGEIRQAAVDALGDVAGKTVWDLYGGVGDAARLLAQRGATVWSVDADAAAVEWARTQDTGGVGGGITYIAGRCEETLHRLPAPDVCLVNPPRTGLHQRVAAALDRWASDARRSGRPTAMSYVSCDPATLARDLSRMSSLDLAGVTAYDLFPQTSHVETLAVLRTP
jgi:23S rRNA (uracil1939-C5)-methyltransferase